MPSENGVATPLPCSTPEEMMTSYPLELRLGAIHLSSFVCVARLIGDIYERPWETPVDPLGDAWGDARGKSVESVKGFPAPLGYPLGTTLRDTQGGPQVISGGHLVIPCPHTRIPGRITQGTPLGNHLGSP